MRRRMATAAIAVTLTGILAVSACSSKSTDSGSGASGGSSASNSGLTISALNQINTEGKEVPPAAESAALNPAQPGGAKCDPSTIAMAGALTGANAALGINIVNGAQLAVDQHNKANPDCKITLKRFDTEETRRRPPRSPRRSPTTTRSSA